MEDRTLVSKMKWIEGELLALKTAHLRGLGTADFCTETTDYHYPNMQLGDAITVKVSFEDDIEEMPFIQTYNAMARFLNPLSASWNNENKTVSILSMCTVGGIDYGGEVKVVASAQIKSIAITKGYE